jgi:biotin operon repressor
MTRTERLLALIQLFRRYRRPATGRQLADAMGVSLRTVYRDIATLVKQGAPIEGEAGVGFILRPGFLLPPLMFRDEEIEALVLGSRWVAQLPDETLSRAAEDALAKILGTWTLRERRVLGLFRSTLRWRATRSTPPSCAPQSRRAQAPFMRDDGRQSASSGRWRSGSTIGCASWWSGANCALISGTFAPTASSRPTGSTHRSLGAATTCSGNGEHRKRQPSRRSGGANAADRI